MPFEVNTLRSVIARVVGENARTATLGWSTILRGDQIDRGQFDHGLSVIERSAQVQSRMVNDLLDASRIISGKLQLELTNMDPAVVIIEAVERARPSLGLSKPFAETGRRQGSRAKFGRARAAAPIS
jgi:signal transduction histidine kinase